MQIYTTSKKSGIIMIFKMLLKKLSLMLTKTTCISSKIEYYYNIQ